ncbi:MAG: hypothetical protein HQ564_03845 [Candidatus Saganbacteria bacterium]|nr:hypothetical protein [Candidatus Saganbacteria bacterium]
MGKEKYEKPGLFKFIENNTYGATCGAGANATGDGRCLSGGIADALECTTGAGADTSADVAGAYGCDSGDSPDCVCTSGTGTG